jgi:hypothetical protein
MDRYIANCNGLPGWDWYIYTDAPAESKGNVHFFPMTAQQFCDKVQAMAGVRPDFDGIKNWRKANDFRPGLGLIFADEIKGFDFWGHTDFDCVYGDLDKYLPDSFLSTVDIFSNDPAPFLCGPFTLYRNIERVNRLFQTHSRWQEVFGGSREHGFEEEGRACCDGATMADVIRTTDLRVIHRFWQSREWLNDSNTSRLIPAKVENGRLTYRGQEAMMIHFNRTKAWPGGD